jgi:energy-coupling factor transporter ATP-binding protein EcfA2
MIETLFDSYIGRDALLASAAEHFNKGRNVLFFGRPGSGKTAMLNMAAGHMASSKPVSQPLYIPEVVPLKQFLLVLCEKLYRRQLLPSETQHTAWEVLEKQLKRDQYSNTVSIILKSFAQHPGVFVALDNLDRITPTGQSIIINLADSSAILCASASRETKNLRRILYHFQKLEIPPMPDDCVRRLSEKFVEDRGLLVQDKKHFVNSMIFKAAGNPLAVERLLLYFENEPHITKEKVEAVHQGAGRKEMSGEWLLLLLGAYMIVLRFVSRATMNKPLYIITSAFMGFFFMFRFLLTRRPRSDQA